MQYHSGKTFLSPPRLIRREKALYFPNLRGYTLANPHEIGDTTSALLGKVSIVSLFSGKWAADQTRTFLEDKEFERQWGLIAGGGAQRVDINVEDDWMKAWIVRMSLGGIKRLRPEEEWGRYFVVRRGFSSNVKESLGIANGKVGYVYLVDEDCKIRWAACGEAAEGENEGLARGVRKLTEGRMVKKDVYLGRSANSKKLDQKAKDGVAIDDAG